MALLILAGIACAFVGTIFLFLWRTTGPEALARYPMTLDLWTVGYLVSLVLDLLLWFILLILVPVIAAAILLYFLWWNKFPQEEKQEYISRSKNGFPHKRFSRRRGRRGGGFLNILFCITWLIIIASEGNWDKAFRLWTFTYLVYSILAAFLWDLLILGAPATIALILWLRREMQKE